MASSRAPTRSSDLLPGYDAAVFAKHAPLLLGVVPFGMVCGIVASDVGLPSAASLGMALLVCAGASQLVALRLVAEGGSVWLVVLSTLIVNLRFVIYSASLAPHFERLPARSKGLLAYLVNDASYAVAVPRFEEYDRDAEHGPGQDDDRYERANRKGRYFLGAGASLLVVWMLSNAAGVFLGARVPAWWPCSARRCRSAWDSWAPRSWASWWACASEDGDGVEGDGAVACGDRHGRRHLRPQDLLHRPARPDGAATRVQRGVGPGARGGARRPRLPGLLPRRRHDRRLPGERASPGRGARYRRRLAHQERAAHHGGGYGDTGGVTGDGAGLLRAGGRWVIGHKNNLS